MSLQPCEDWYLLKPTTGIALMLAAGPTQNMQPKFGMYNRVPYPRKRSYLALSRALLRLRNKTNFSISAVVERGGLSFSINMR